MKNNYLRQNAFYLVMAALCLSLPYPGLLHAQDSGASKDLTAFSLEDLMNMEVTSVSKKEQPLNESPAAIYVITQEDIHRSNALNIAELLRTVPGLHVARINGNQYAITARGFNGLFANKLLVLIDGRSVYSPLFSGVYWDIQDTVLEDIERIEVIRGPGASLWGANAVNGVINIITKSAHATKGVMASTAMGNEQRVATNLHYGFAASENTDIRVYGKFHNQDNQEVPETDDSASDFSKDGRGGFRSDTKLDADHITFDGEIYSGMDGHNINRFSTTPPLLSQRKGNADFDGEHLLGKWEHDLAKDSHTSLQMYYDRTYRDDLVHRETYETFDIDFQHALSPFEHNDLLWGLGVRSLSDTLKGKDTLTLSPPSETKNLFNFFLQDEHKFLDDKLHLILGAKVEHNDYTGVEFQPTARLLWAPSKSYSVWASYSHAVRTPSRAESNVSLPVNEFQLPNGLTAVSIITGSPRFKSEQLDAYEVGVRVEPFDTLTFDLATFYNDYYDITSIRPAGTPYPSDAQFSSLVVPVTFGNAGAAAARGGELLVTWQVASYLRLQSSYSYLSLDTSVNSSNGDSSIAREEGLYPRSQVYTHAQLDLPWNLEFDASYRYVGRLAFSGTDSYNEVGARLGWHISKNIEVSLHAVDALHPEHSEYLVLDALGAPPTEIERSVFGKVTLTF